MAKKGKKKKPNKDDDKSDSKANDEENLEGEILDLKKKLEEAEAQLREESKLIDRLSRDNESKAEQLRNMELALSKELEKQQAAFDLLQEEGETQRLSAEHTINVLEKRVSELEINLEASSTLKESNVSLAARVNELLQELEEEDKTHAAELQKARKSMFNHKMNLEQTFRKALQELDSEYRNKAFEAMSAESKNALAANAKLKEELSLQSVGVENLLHRFNAQAEGFHKLKVENEILEKGSSIRLKEVALMKRRQYEYETMLVESQKSAAKNQKERQEEAKEELKRTKEELEHMQNLYFKAQERCAKWKERAMKLATTESTSRSTADLHSDRSTERSKMKSALLKLSGSAKSPDARMDFNDDKASHPSNKTAQPTNMEAIWNSRYAEVECPSPSATMAIMRDHSRSLSRCVSAPTFDELTKDPFEINIPLKLPTHNNRSLTSLSKTRVSKYGNIRSLK